MIDLHSHILHEVDDGARSFNESIDMLKIAIDQGVTTQVLTPHIQFGRYNNTKANLQKAFCRFESKTQNLGLNIDLRLAAEVRIGPEIMRLVEDDQIPWLGYIDEKKVLLLEFPRVDVPLGSDKLVQWLLQRNILPMIAHPERNKTFLKNPSKLTPFIDMGCPLQITASSLLGRFGNDAKVMSHFLLENNHVFAIASDCHNLKGRAPDLKQAYVYLSNILESKKLDDLFKNNPLRLLGGCNY